MYNCVNCEWKGNELSKQSEGAMHDGKCPVCGDEVVKDGEMQQEEVVPKEKLKETPLEDMTKDELNDFAATNFPELEIKYWWTKNKILKNIKSYSEGEQ